MDSSKRRREEIPAFPFIVPSAIDRSDAEKFPEYYFIIFVYLYWQITAGRASKFCYRTSGNNVYIRGGVPGTIRTTARTYPNRTNNTEESKLVFLYSLVAEKLLAQEALARHVDQDSMYRYAVSGIKKMLARDQLYREEVSGKIKISREEVQSAVIDAKRQLFLSFLYFEDSTDAEFVRKQLKNCKQFSQFQIDTTMAVLRDTASLFWGEAEAPIEQAAFRLKKGECSPVVTASTGFYILHLEKDLPDPFYNSMQPHVLYERVETKLRLRKEKARLDEYIQDVLKTKIGFSLPGSFKILAKNLTEVWKNESPSAKK